MKKAPPADLEIAANVRAAQARWQRKGRAKTITTGDLEREEVRDREPEHPNNRSTYRNMRRFWAFRARLAEALRREPS
jgi:hypothetical protein